MTTLVALSGGIGGAKLALGLYRSLPPGTLKVVANTGDDFEHLGLMICPDVDTVLYTLAGISNTTLGWGREIETWTFMNALQTLGGETWFRLGDGDLAIHLERTRRLSAGDTLTSVTAEFAHRLGIDAEVLPMCNAAVRTRVVTPDGELAFQDYFVRRQCQPRVTRLRYEGASSAQPSAEIRSALQDSALEAVVICPSNPYLSVAPILAVAGMDELLHDVRAPIIAVTPLIDGRAIKGPTAKIMSELGIDPSPVAVAHYYRGLIDGFVLDNRDRALESRLDVPVLVTNTLMQSLDDRERLAREVIDFAGRLRAPKPVSAAL